MPNEFWGYSPYGAEEVVTRLERGEHGDRNWVVPANQRGVPRSVLEGGLTSRNASRPRARTFRTPDAYPRSPHKHLHWLVDEILEVQPALRENVMRLFGYTWSKDAAENLKYILRELNREVGNMPSLAVAVRRESTSILAKLEVWPKRSS